jgi:hypothetical protein
MGPDKEKGYGWFGPHNSSPDMGLPGTFYDGDGYPSGEQRKNKDSAGLRMEW